MEYERIDEIDEVEEVEEAEEAEEVEELFGESEILSLEEVEGNNLITQKSEPLYVALAKSNLGYEELLLIDTYLGRIDSHNPKARAVRFGKKTLERIWGKTKINKSTLLSWIHNVTNIPIDIAYNNGDDIEIESFKLFDYSKINGKITSSLMTNESLEIDINSIVLECDRRAVKYIFNIESIGYLRYRVETVALLGGRQAYDMFSYIEKNRFRKKWDVDLDELKRILKCENIATYEEYKYFNSLVLKRIHKIICERTKCKYTYSPIRRGGKVAKVHFEVEELPYEIMDKEVQDKLYKEKMEELNLPFWATALCINDVCEFTQSQLSVIQEVMTNVPDYLLFKNKEAWGAEACKYNYIAEKYAILNQVDESKQKNGERIEKRFEYLVQMIRRDTEV